MSVHNLYLIVVCFDRLLTKSKSEEDFKHRLISAEAQINQLTARLNDANDRQKRIDAENAVSHSFFHYSLYSRHMAQ